MINYSHEAHLCFVFTTESNIFVKQDHQLEGFHFGIAYPYTEATHCGGLEGFSASKLLIEWFFEPHS
jgi:hypothetical protein